MFLFHYVPWPTVGRFLSALLPVVIAGIAVYIAWQQFAVNRRQYRLALFEERLRVFSSTRKMIALVLTTSNPDLAGCHRFLVDTREDLFLFGPEVAAFINEVYEMAMELRARVQAGPDGAARRTEILKWFGGKSEVANEIFLKYMDFRKP